MNRREFFKTLLAGAAGLLAGRFYPQKEFVPLEQFGRWQYNIRSISPDEFTRMVFYKYSLIDWDAIDEEFRHDAITMIDVPIQKTVI